MGLTSLGSQKKKKKSLHCPAGLRRAEFCPLFSGKQADTQDKQLLKHTWCPSGNNKQQALLSRVVDGQSSETPCTSSSTNRIYPIFITDSSPELFVSPWTEPSLWVPSQALQGLTWCLTFLTHLNIVDLWPGTFTIRMNPTG